MEGQLPTLGDLIRGPGNMKPEPLIWDEFFKLGVPRAAELHENSETGHGEEIFVWVWRSPSLTEGGPSMYRRRTFLLTNGQIIEVR